MTNKYRKAGYDRGYNIASWIDLPEFGDVVPKDIDWIGINKIESVDDAAEVFNIIAHETESNNRQFSPFEFEAHEINTSDDPDQNWDDYDQGISEGIAANWEERKAYYSE